MDLNNPSIKFACITIMHQKKENILPDAKATTYTFLVLISRPSNVMILMQRMTRP
jgi:hypothetical protein